MSTSQADKPQFVITGGINAMSQLNQESNATGIMNEQQLNNMRKWEY